VGKMISIDSETSGIDLYHGAKPFFVVMCEVGSDEPFYFEWEVDPLTREPQVLSEDIEEIKALIASHDTLVLQNGKFDVAALRTLDPWFANWPWEKTEDTLIAGHLLSSNTPHDLTTMTETYVGRPIQQWEDDLEEAVVAARRACRSHYKDWAIAREGRQDMPSAKGQKKLWKVDSWLPRALWQVGYEKADASWETVLREYAKVDAWATVHLWLEQIKEIRRRGLEKIYRTSLKRSRLAHIMENRGITVSKSHLYFLQEKYREESTVAGEMCERIAAEYNPPFDLKMPRAGSNKVLDAFTDCVLKNYNIRCDTQRMVDVQYTETGRPSTAKTAVDYYRSMLPPHSKEKRFFDCLSDKRRRDTAISYLDGYKRFWLPLGKEQFHEETDSKSISAEGEKDQELLDMDGGKIPKRIRSVRGSRGVESTSGSIPSVRRDHTERDVGNSQLRQSGLRQSRSSEVGDSSGEHERYDSEGEGRQGQGRPAPDGNDNRSRRIGDEKILHRQRRSERSTGGLVSSLPLKPCPDMRNYPREILEAFAGGDWYVLHPSLNPTGTDTLRWSSSQPNSQNVSKNEDLNLRYCFGPAPGREWWSLDAKNIELRIPAYESGQKDLIDLFERPDDPPFYGSTHLLNFSVVYPDLWEKELREVGLEKVGPHCKKKYASSWYQWCKNGGFKLQYGGINADPTFHRVGATDLLRARFSKLEALNQHYIRYAEKHGYVETMPDRSVDPDHGYPLLCSRTEYGRIKPTVPLNYHVQGTAMWWTMMAMIRCQDYLDTLNKPISSHLRTHLGYHMTIQCHDELVFDFPRGTGAKPWNTNLPKIRRIQSIMERCGDGIGVPIPVGVEFHGESWAEGVTL
jgi:DNA polymerase I-like protein with 3'-5' exonuclease and polymerase domains